jgi:hypothetical protein
MQFFRLAFLKVATFTKVVGIRLDPTIGPITLVTTLQLLA